MSQSAKYHFFQTMATPCSLPILPSERCTKRWGWHSLAALSHMWLTDWLTSGIQAVPMIVFTCNFYIEWAAAQESFVWISMCFEPGCRCVLTPITWLKKTISSSLFSWTRVIFAQFSLTSLSHWTQIRHVTRTMPSKLGPMHPSQSSSSTFHPCPAHHSCHPHPQYTKPAIINFTMVCINGRSDSEQCASCVYIASVRLSHIYFLTEMLQSVYHSCVSFTPSPNTRIVPIFQNIQDYVVHISHLCFTSFCYRCFFNTLVR